VRPVPRSADNNYLARLLSDLVAHAQSWPFREPVKREDVPDYYDVIRNPMGMFS
jgi:histone acetyltransferase